jgi:hypothetical protein
MNFKTLLPALALVALSTPAIADENISNFNVGPTFFAFKGKDTVGDMTVEQKGLFCGARAEVSYIQPNAMYLGATGVFSPGAQTVYHTFNSASSKQGVAAGLKASSYLWQMEGRAGKHYTISETSTLMPYAGIGTYHISSSVSQKSLKAVAESTSEMRLDWAYFAFGGVASTTLNPMIDLGIGMKALRHFYSNQENIQDGVATDTKLHSRWGYEISAPVKFNLGQAQGWTVLAEPFMLKMDVSHAIHVLGARCSVQKSF